MGFEIRGVVEGFYGPFYTFAERNELLRFLAAHGFNYYLYGPKNDRTHRARWREAYPPELLARFGETVALARELGIRFSYALSPVSMSYASPEEEERIRARFRAFYDLGVRDFALFFDDVTVRFRHEADAERYGSFAQAQADVGNRVYAWLQALDPACRLSVCPTEYHGVPPFGSYVHELGARLRPEIDLYYTGPDVCCPAIGAGEVQAFARAVGRTPILWDNYPVNDLGMQFELHIGPVRGRAPDLAAAVKGVVVNPMLQAEASKIPLATFAAYLADPWGYDPDRAWEAALVEVAGAEVAPALRRFAENSLHSCLGTPEAERLERLAMGLVSALEAGDEAGRQAAVAGLEGYLAEIDEARYFLTTRLENAALRSELLPWIVTLDHWHRAAAGALAVLGAAERGEPYEGPMRLVLESLDYARRPRRSGGQVLQPLAESVLRRAQAGALARRAEGTPGFPSQPVPATATAVMGHDS